MSREVWLDVGFHYPSTMVWIRDAENGEEIINLSAEQDYTWKAADDDLRLDDVSIVSIRMHDPLPARAGATAKAKKPGK